MSVNLGSRAEISRHRFSFEHLSAESGTEPYANGSEPWVFTASDGDRGEAAHRRARRRRSSEPEDYAGQFERYAGGPGRRAARPR